MRTENIPLNFPKCEFLQCRGNNKHAFQPLVAEGLAIEVKSRTGVCKMISAKARNLWVSEKNLEN